MRPGDALARLGGDQFALAVMQTMDEREQRLLAEEMRAAINAGMNIAGQEIVLTGSIGIAVFDTKAPAANNKARFLPSCVLIFAAVILISPGGKTPTNEVIKPKKSGVIMFIYLILKRIYVIDLFISKYCFS